MPVVDHTERRIVFTSDEAFMDCDGESLPMRVIKTRESNGQASIRAEFAGEVLEFNTDMGVNGALEPDYEYLVKEFIHLLQRAIDQPCELPDLIKE